MDTAESQAYNSYMGGMTPGEHYSGAGHVTSGDMRLAAQPAVGTQVRHRLSGETGTVTGVHVHGHTGESMPTVRWSGQPSTGFTADQGYSLDNLTNP